MNDVLAIILGGGQGSRLFPLTHQRSKPAVPIGGKYRLIDVPISNCLHADLRRIFVLTQFNSASLNHHVAQSYHMDPFSHGLRRHHRGRADAGQLELVSGHRRRGAPGGAALPAVRRRLLSDSRRRSSLSHGLRAAARRARRSGRRHHGRRAAGDAGGRAGDGHLSSSIATGRSWGSRKSRTATGWRRSAAACRRGRCSAIRPTTSAEAVHRVDGHLRVLARGAARAAAEHDGHRFRARDHPGRARRRIACARICTTATGPTSERSSRSTTRTSCSQSRMRRSSSTIRGGRSTRTSGFCRRRTCARARCANRSSPTGAFSTSARSSSRSSASARTSPRGTRITRSVLLGADMYASDAPTARHRPRRGARSRHHRQERVDRRRRAAGERSRRAARRRRRLLHPRRHHHRAEGRPHRARYRRLGNRRQTVPARRRSNTTHPPRLPAVTQY